MTVSRRPLASTIVFLTTLSFGCGGPDDVDLNAGVEAHLALTSQTLEELDVRCDTAQPDVCGEEFLRRTIADDCASTPDDATDAAGWRLLRESIGTDVAAIKLAVMAAACPERADEWERYDLSLGS